MFDQQLHICKHDTVFKYPWDPGLAHIVFVCLDALGNVPYHYLNCIQNTQYTWCLIRLNLYDRVWKTTSCLCYCRVKYTTSTFKPQVDSASSLQSSTKEYEREMKQCPEAKCVPANSIQSTGFIEFSEETSHMFSGFYGRRSASHYSPTGRSITCCHCFTYLVCLWTLHSWSFSACLAGVAGQREKEGLWCSWDVPSCLRVSAQQKMPFSLPVVSMLNHKRPYRVIFFPEFSCKYENVWWMKAIRRRRRGSISAPAGTEGCMHACECLEYQSGHLARPIHLHREILPANSSTELAFWNLWV